jgi:hypothetical protein
MIQNLSSNLVGGDNDNTDIVAPDIEHPTTRINFALLASQ